MALVAAPSEPPVVHVVSLVTCIAICADNLTQGLLVTSCARDFAVRAIEREFGTALVIKTPHGPAPRNVAGIAFLAKRLFVNIIFFVATDAGVGCFAVTRGLVAILAFRDTVPTSQREFRLVVIEPGVLPCRIAVTACAIFAEFTFVDIIIRVTRNAVDFEFLRVQRTRVAPATQQRDMAAGQSKFRQLVMIETRLLPVLCVMARLAPITIVTLV